MLLARPLGEYARLPLRGEWRFLAPIVKSHNRMPSIKPYEISLTTHDILVNQLYLKLLWL